MHTPPHSQTPARYTIHTAYCAPYLTGGSLGNVRAQAGGLAGQYRFGGRTGASVQLLGLLKIVIGLVGAAWAFADSSLCCSG